MIIASSVFDAPGHWTTRRRRRHDQPRMPHLGFIGLGTMGAPMAGRLLKCGYAVTVWARRPEAMAPLLASGAKSGASPADVAAHSDITITMVTDSRAVEDVILGARGIAHGARPGRW